MEKRAILSNPRFLIPAIAIKRWLRGIVLTTIISCLNCSVLSAADFLLLSSDGTWHTGPTNVQGQELQVAGKKINLHDVIAAQQRDLSPVPQVDQGIILANGDVIAGATLSLQNGQASLTTDRFGTHTIPAEALAAFILAPQTTHNLTRINVMSAGAEFSNGDALSGNLTFLNNGSAGINTGKRIIDIPRSRLTLLRLETALTPSSAPHYLRLVSGELVSGTIITLTDKQVVLEHSIFGKITLPIEMVACWWTVSTHIQPLSQIASTSTQTGFLDAGIAPEKNRTWRGDILKLAGNTVEHGLYTRARSEATFTLTQPATAFVVTVARDQAYGQRGDAVVRVLGDKKVLTEVTLADHNSHTITVPLAGISTLTLITDSGADGTTTDDEVVWAWAAVIHAGP